MARKLIRIAWNRFKLKFSTDRVDTMVIQAIALLDDLDKEINIYSMRVKVSARGSDTWWSKRWTDAFATT
jgi:RNA processing factor Prp31